MNIRFLPTKGQWRRWTLPSKATFAGTVVGILMGVFTILTYFLGNSPQIFQEGSNNIHKSRIAVQENSNLGSNITGMASENGTAIINIGSGQVYVTNLHGISAEQFQRLSEELGVTRSALKNFFHIIEQGHVPPEALDSQLRKIAKTYKELLEKLEGFTADNPSSVTLKQEARQALEAGDFARVEQLLNQASEADVEAAKQLQETATKRLLSAAASKLDFIHFG